MHAIDPTIRFLTKFPAHSIFLKGEYHYSPLLSSVNLQTILLQIRAYGACDCGQVNHPARQSAPYKKKEYSFISNRQRRGKKARNVRRGEVGFEPRTFG